MVKLDFSKLDGLVTAVAQDWQTGEILMVAFMNAESWELTQKTGIMHYWSRSRGKLWKKGEESGHFQKVLRILTDCDEDCLIYEVQQTGAACHTGYMSCFYRTLDGTVISSKVFDPEKVYKKPGH